MQPAIKALSLSTAIFGILIIAFSATALYSVMNIGVSLGEVNIFPSSVGVDLALPFFINNNGYYDLSELNVNTHVTDQRGNLISQSETFVPLISRGSTVETAHKVSVELTTIISMDYIQYLLNDSFLELETLITLDFARIIPIEMSIDTTIPWGAPFSNFSIGEIHVVSYGDDSQAVIPLFFENHALIDITGTIRLEVYNDLNELVISEKTVLDIPSQSVCNRQIYANLTSQDALKLTKKGNVHVVFENPMFIVDWWTTYG